MDSLHVSNVIQTIANASKDNLVEFTKVINNDAFPGVVDQFMDQVTGLGHRVAFGHDFSYLPEIFDKFGLSGAYDYFVHLGKDIMSPDGIPIPFAKEIGDSLGMGTMQQIDWLSLNIGDVVSGGFSIYHTVHVIDVLQSGELSTEVLVPILIGAGAKIVFSISSCNPIGLASGIVDMAALLYYAYPLYSEYLIGWFSSETVLEQMLESFAASTGMGFILSFIIESLRNFKSLREKKVSFAEYLAEITKKSAINGIISGFIGLATFCLCLITGMSPIYLSPLVACVFVTGRYVYGRNKEMIKRYGSDLFAEAKQEAKESYQFINRKIDQLDETVCAFYDNGMQIMKPHYFYTTEKCKQMFKDQGSYASHKIEQTEKKVLGLYRKLFS